MRTLLNILIGLASLPVGALADDALYEREPINYLKVTPQDDVARLASEIAAGRLKLEYEPRFGYLVSLLKSLKIPVSSQVLVFSKTSFQRDLISPQRPRAIYFNDQTYVGFVPGGDVIEITATDPVNGPMYYTLRQKRDAKPAIARQTDSCLQCHASAMTQDLPGHIVRSVFPDAEGQPILSAGTFRTSPASPLKQRWGGWYVTGRTGAQTHMGNVYAADKDDPSKTDFTAGLNLTSLAEKFDTSAYLSPHSDVVALMVLEHQTHLHNLITRANYLARTTMYDAHELNKALGRPPEFLSESTLSRIRNAGEPLVKALLGGDEITLTDEVKGTSEFAREFSAQGPHDSQGRSLRQLDLKTRLLKYRCSYLIFSPAFTHLPAEVKAYVEKRLGEILKGEDESKDSPQLDESQRKAILEILRETGQPIFEDKPAAR